MATDQFSFSDVPSLLGMTGPTAEAGAAFAWLHMLAIQPSSIYIPGPHLHVFAGIPNVYCVICSRQGLIIARS